MEKDTMHNINGVQNSRIGTGLLLLLAGVLLLAYKMGAPIPGWIFTWPVLLIGIGLLVGIKSRFQNPGSLIMILIGSIFLADKTIPGIDFHSFLIPVLLIGIGLIVIFRPRGDRFRRKNIMNYPVNDSFNVTGMPTTERNFKPLESNEADSGEYINVQAILGGVKRNVQSKNFKGGEILSFLGGSEISFMQADIQHPIVLEVNNVFGGTKLIIPSNWDVQNNISAVFGGVEDKRVFNNSAPDSNKKILLKGSCVFGGIEVTNY